MKDFQLSKFVVCTDADLSSEANRRFNNHGERSFISLMVYRILEKQLEKKYTCGDIISTLRDMDVRQLDDYGYIPGYTRTALTDALHENAGFRTDYELITPKSMAGIVRRSKGL